MPGISARSQQRFGARQLCGFRGASHPGRAAQEIGMLAKMYEEFKERETQLIVIGIGSSA